MTAGVEIRATGPLATIQDTGRPGLAALGVGRSGAADLPALLLGNRLLANDPSAAAIEVTFGGLEVRAHGDLMFAVTGAACPVTVDDRERWPYSPITVADGEVVRLHTPPRGMRSYLCVRGGIDVPPVLGSRSTDTLAGLGPAVPTPGTILPVGAPPGRIVPLLDHAAVSEPTGDVVSLRAIPGPRADWFTPDALTVLVEDRYTVTPQSDRVGMRLTGPRLQRRDSSELPSEGMSVGSLQVPPSGLPTLFLADHPVTGGYPVIAVVVAADIPAAAQARPGQELAFRLDPSPLPSRPRDAARPG